MNYTNLTSLQELELRLSALKKKYKEVTHDLEIELNENQQSEDMNNYFLLMYDREMLEKQIEKVKSFIKSQKSSVQVKDKSRKVEVGSKVKLKNHTHDLEIQVVNTHEAQPSNGFISMVSPIGKAILGKKKGDDITVELPGRKIEYKIVSIA